MTDTPGAPRPRVGPWWLVALLLTAYLLTAAAAGTQSPCDNDLGGVFLPSARLIAAGYPQWMYQVRIGVYPNANGPLSEFAIAGALIVGRDLGLATWHVGAPCGHIDVYPLKQDSIPLRMWLSVVFALFPLGIAIEVMRLADRWRPRPFTGWRRLLIWCLLLLTPALWDSLIYYGHYEQSMALWLGLLAVRAFTDRRAGLAGVLLGLSLLCRATAIFVAIPLGVILLRDRQFRRFGWLAGMTAATTAAGLAPFYITGRNDLLYSLNGFRKLLPIEDGSIWTFLRYTSLGPALQGYDSTFALLAALAMTVALLCWRRDGLWLINQNDPRLYAVICVASVCFALFIKTVWGYYFYDPLIWGTAWVLASRAPKQRWWEMVAPSVVCTALLLITEFRIALQNKYFADTGASRTWVLVESAGEFLLIVVLQVGIFIALTRRYQARAPNVTTGMPDAYPTVSPTTAE